MKDKLSEEQIKMLHSALKNAVDILCPKCNSSVFTEGIKLKKLSRLLTGEMKDSIIPIPVIICLKCNEELNLEENGESKILS
jgi:ssDNA-binding Zn-finger/Zn-ribbon topoisomerase 1